LNKETFIIIGKLPPPYIGPAVATQTILNSKLSDKYRLIHLDTSDHRAIDTLGKFDFWNFYIPIKSYILLIYYIIKTKPSLVYTTVSQSTVGYIKDSIFILIVKLFGKKVVCHLRGGYLKCWYESQKPFMKWYFRIIHKRVDAQIVLGHNLKPIFNWLLDEHRIFVIPNGANYPELLDGTAYPTDDSICVLFLSNYIKAKGIMEVIEASQYFKNTQVNFVCAGDWYEPETRSEIEIFMQKNPALPLSLVGPVSREEKINCLKRAHIFVLPTYYANEGHPWVIVEAMAAGLPIIACDQGAIIESVIDGVNGFIVEKKKPEQISAKINFLVQNPSVRIKMGQESQKLYLDNFTEDKMIEKLARTFDYVIGRENKTAAPVSRIP